jgi:hypothetical protein
MSAPPAWYDPASWGGALSGIGDGIGRNSGMLLGLGAGLLSGNLGEIPQAISQGASADRARNLQNYQLALQAQGRQAASDWAKSIGHPEWAPAAAAGGLSIGDMFAATRPVPVSGDGYLANPSTGLPESMSGSALMPGGSAAAPASAGGGAPSALMGNGVYRQMTPEERKSLGVGPNDPYVVNNATGKPVYVGNPTSVNINNQGESAYAKARGGDLAVNMKDIQNARMQAYGTIGQLNLLQQALSGTYQGTGGQTVQKLKKLAQSMGIDVSGVADGDLANSISNQLALQLRNPNGGAGMPGSLSDSDRQFLTTMAPGLANSKGGNALMIEAAKRVQQRNIIVGQLASAYAQKHNNQLDDNFFNELQAYSDAHPLFDDLIKAMPQSGAPAAPAAPPPAAGPSAPVDMGGGITIQQIN